MDEGVIFKTMGIVSGVFALTSQIIFGPLDISWT